MGARFGGARHPRIDKIVKITAGVGARFGRAIHHRSDKIDKSTGGMEQDLRSLIF